MSKFGWSYPPGAANDSNAPYNQDDGITPLQDAVADLLTNAGIAEPLIDKIMLLIIEGESQRGAGEADAYAYAAQLEEEKRLAREYAESNEETLICLGCGNIRDHCECNQFDSERK